MNQLLRVLQRDLVKITKLALYEEKKLIVQESRLAGYEKTTFSVLLVSKWNIAFAVFVVDSFVYEEVFTDDDDSARARVTWYLNEHVS